MVNAQTEQMATEQMSYLLHMVSTATRRKFSGEEGSLWLHLLDGYTYDECHEAFTEYLRYQSDEYLTPGLIISIIKAKRRERWVKSGDAVIPPNGLSGAEYLKWLKNREKEVTRPPVAPNPAGTKVITRSAQPAVPAIEA